VVELELLQLLRESGPQGKGSSRDRGEEKDEERRRRASTKWRCLPHSVRIDIDIDIDIDHYYYYSHSPESRILKAEG
jgi:hypothetical protein